MSDHQKALDEVKEMVRLNRAQMAKEMLRSMDGHAKPSDLVLQASQKLEPYVGAQEALSTVQGLLTLQALNILSAHEQGKDEGQDEMHSITIDLSQQELELIESAASALGVSPAQFIMIAATQAAIKILQANGKPIHEQAI